MNRLNIIFLISILASGIVSAQTQVEIKRDNGTASQQHTTGGYEETVILSPAGPAKIVTLKIYYQGSWTRNDTVHIVGDPAEGGLPPTSSVWHYNERTQPIVVQYDGTPGWRTIDLRDRNLHVSGYERVVIQHRIGVNAGEAVGPFFAMDNSAGAPLASFLYDPINNNSLGFPGNYFRAAGDYLVRIVVEYDLPVGNTSAQPPAASLVDRTIAYGLVDASNAPIKASRVSVADWNGDGWDDVAIGSAFLQNDGDGTFTNVSAQVGISAGSTVWGDYDNDGDVDAYAANGGNDAVWRNDGNNTFTNVTQATGITNPSPTVTPIWLDYNRDGKLDLFISNGRTENNGAEVYFRDAMWRNNGDGTFSDATGPSGIGAGEPSTPYDTWGASATDYNQDGFVDIHVATYRLAPDLLWRNNGDGTLTEVGEQTGVRGVETTDPQFFGHGIGSDWGDYNSDGLPDLAVGNLGHPDWRGSVSNPSLVYRNNGAPDFDFTEVHDELGIKFFEMNAGVVWLDIDDDGYLDLWHCQYAYQPSGTSGEPTRRSRIYLNGGPEKNFKFEDATWQLGSLIHGAWTAARGDFDRDGRMDLVVASPHVGVRLYHNELAAKGSFVTFRLAGSPANNVPMDGIGTRITVYADGRKYYRELMGGGTGATASQNSNQLHFGLGRIEAIDSVVVQWANSVTSVIPRDQISRGRNYRLQYPNLLTAETTTSIEREDDATDAFNIVGLTYVNCALMFRVDGKVGSDAT
ncbi:MAG: CRTAC1 family protein, partial [bacterium]|nr:CRTAC1 family protein [Candidatus Kapabacteria bacterium]